MADVCGPTLCGIPIISGGATGGGGGGDSVYVCVCAGA